MTTAVAAPKTVPPPPISGGIDAWLIVARCNLDDVPLGLVGSQKAARLRAAKLTTRDEVHAAISELCETLPQWDVTGLIALDMYRFRKGVLVYTERLEDLLGSDDDDPTEAVSDPL